MVGLKFRNLILSLGAVLLSAAVASPSAGDAASARPANLPGSPLTRSDNTPFKPSKAIVHAQWSSKRFDPPANQTGDILPTVWSDDGGTYVLMDDGGVDVPVPGGLWRQSLARVSGKPPNLRFRHVGDPTSPWPSTWSQINDNPDKDDGPLGPYYSIGFTEADGIFYATQQRDWNWSTNGPFTGLAGIAYSRDHGKTWRTAGKSFPAPLGNLTFVDQGGRGGSARSGYVYAIGTEREFNATQLLIGRVRTGLANITDPADWQWFGGAKTGAGGKRSTRWVSSPAAAVPALSWSSHITYPQMTYDAPLHRYLLTFTYSYSSRIPAVWNGGAELVILEAPTPTGPFSFVARSSEFGPSNGYGAGFPSQWISPDGRNLWLKWAANFDGCQAGLNCSGKYGFNLARVHLTVGPHATGDIRVRLHAPVVYVLSASLPLLVAFALGRRRARAIRNAVRRTPRGSSS
jgi:hypothetical protein